jgi:hypothetical protein
MYIVHEASDAKEVRKILHQGILPARITGNWRYELVSNPDHIYLCIKPFDRNGEDARYEFQWGQYNFVLNDNWVREHAEQFMENTNRFTLVFGDALNNYGIKARNSTPAHADDRSYLGLVSTKPIPVEGLELLVLSSGRHGIEFKQMLPKHMGLYLWDGYNKRVLVAKEPERR